MMRTGHGHKNIRGFSENIRGFSPLNPPLAPPLVKMEKLFSHLPAARAAQLTELINSFPCLFFDSPTRTHLIEHDIIVSDDVKPIKQIFYRVNVEKQKQMEEQINYMFET